MEAEHLRVRKAIELGFTPPAKDSFADVAARYQHLSPAFMAEAVGRLDTVFALESPLEVPQLPAAVEAEAVSLPG